MIFECPRCKQRLSVSPTEAGRVAACPSCNKRIQIPKPPAEAAAPAGATPESRGTPSQRAEDLRRKTERQAWEETDPTNPNAFLSLGIGVSALLLWFGLLLPFNPPAGKPVADYSTMQFIAALFYKHFLASFVNTGFFTWAISIVVLKHRKIRHQKAALLLDVLPMNLGREINAGNVALFIDHVYSLPVRLRDSLMVNRIRKALELYEIRHSSSDVREMMVSQSEIDSARITGSYTLLRAFLWAIPLVGFIGTVVGLSHAIAGMNFANVEDIGKIVGAINNVTSGLGTAFDATLLGLVLALILNFPLNAYAKQEDDTLQTIDAFCNEVLLPRLQDTESTAHPTDSAAHAESVARSIAATQATFLAGLGQLVQQMNESAANLGSRMEAFSSSMATSQANLLTGLNQLVQQTNQHATILERRSDSHQQAIMQELANTTAQMRAQHQAVMEESLTQVANSLGGLETGIGSLNQALQRVHEKQIVIVTPPKKRGWLLGLTWPRKNR